MAADQAQIALEFVRTLSAEAQAHREYLQLLYVVTLGVVGGGLLLIAGAFVWLAQRSLKDVKQEVSQNFDEKIREVVERKEQDASMRIEKLDAQVSRIGLFQEQTSSEFSNLREFVNNLIKKAQKDLQNFQDQSSDVINSALEAADIARSAASKALDGETEAARAALEAAEKALEAANEARGTIQSEIRTAELHNVFGEPIVRRVFCLTNNINHFQDIGSHLVLMGFNYNLVNSIDRLQDMYGDGQGYILVVDAEFFDRPGEVEHFSRFNKFARKAFEIIVLDARGGVDSSIEGIKVVTSIGQLTGYLNRRYGR